MSPLPATNRLLIVDDEEGPRESLNLVFKDEYEVEAVSSGDEAIALSSEEPFSTAILDIRMEGKSGIEVLRELKGIYPYTEIIILTAYETLESARQAISLGASDYLSKPFDVEHIQEVVKRCQERFTFMTRQDLLLQDNITKVKNEFLAVLSHELNTPMNGILGFLELLSDTELKAEQETLLRDIKSSSQTLFETINDLLNYAVLGSKDQKISCTRFNPANRLLSLVVRNDDRKSGLDFKLSISPLIPTSVYGPEAEIETVLAKLIDNAIKFTPSGEVEVSIASKRKDAGRLLLEYKITDTGIGIASQIIETGRIFEPFNQGDNSLTRPYGGLGLGLSLCKKLSSKIDATLNIGSSPGKGCCIEFSVPVDTSKPDSFS